MIKLITGKKGSGKTKILIDRINKAQESTTGVVVCIEKGTALRREIGLNVRWCGVGDYAIDSTDAFYGFVAGLLAGNYDIKDIYVDGILKITGADPDELGALLDKLNILTGVETTITLSISADKAELPESVTKYID